MDFNLNLGCIDDGNLEGISESSLYDVLVVGTGPAAVSSAVYAARKGLKTAMIGLKIGGQVLDTKDIENIIGVPKTTGMEYAENLEKHLKEYCVALKEGTYVTNLEADGKDKIVTTSDNKKYKSKTVIIATGAKWRELNVPGEQEYKGKGVHYCATCDGPFYKGLDVAIVGGGNSGVEAALDMSGIAKSVTVVEFMPELKADKVLIDKLGERNNVKVITNVATTEIFGEDFTKGLKYKNRADDSISDLNIDGVFIEIGLTPNSEFAKNLVETNRFGEIIINENNMTNVKGVFAAGDVTTVKQKQIVISVGEGAKAALNAFEYLIKEY
ncbi:MAG: FAD-dependent oxidoreductase [Sebaldella sp.]|nr:FAD-dependent oxidoreductase [Sebaldella sp.]